MGVARGDRPLPHRGSAVQRDHSSGAAKPPCTQTTLRCVYWVFLRARILHMACHPSPVVEYWLTLLRMSSCAGHRAAVCASTIQPAVRTHAARGGCAARERVVPRAQPAVVPGQGPGQLPEAAQDVRLERAAPPVAEEPEEEEPLQGAHRLPAHGRQLAPFCQKQTVYPRICGAIN